MAGGIKMKVTAYALFFRPKGMKTWHRYTVPNKSRKEVVQLLQRYKENDLIRKAGYEGDLKVKRFTYYTK